MDLLVIIFGIFGWIYNSQPLLMATLIISSISFPLLCAVHGIDDKLSDFTSGFIYIVGIVTSLVKILQ